MLGPVLRLGLFFLNLQIHSLLVPAASPNPWKTGSNMPRDKFLQQNTG